MRQWCIFSVELFKLYSDAVPRELETLPGIIIGGCNLITVRYADDTVLMADSEIKLQDPQQNVADETDKKGLTINHKKTESMDISKIKNPQMLVTN